MPDSTPRLILGSTSRYRRELLERLRLPFEVVAPLVDETPLPGEAPADLAMRLAVAKARAVAAQHPDAVVIGSDQVALCEGTVLGKPGSFERALEQLRLMSGREVVFHSALAVVRGERVSSEDVMTHCRVRELDEASLVAYLRAETPYDTAGSAKAEALGIALMASIRSDDPTALIGLPLIALTRMLVDAGIDPLRSAAPREGAA
ncbi:septum formation protein Maf [Verticiella sediminum]|uniref:7-methyl-GTP pyrophosphatase n=1 Tax=Verticiella sediminum TaxID=1247510 RepID=A0A556AS14_9BURK|nr:Maf family nucleotide pyrophosphatase [Verticiella sediminum]TSH95751.1 septum formation protein Maf [Verticiella sediminum]